MESVKVARGLASTPLVGNAMGKIALNLGVKQVAELKLIHIHGEALAPAEGFYYGVYRKSDQAPPELAPETVAIRDTNWLVMGRFDTGDAGYTGPLGFDRQYPMPAGTILMNSAQAVVRPLQATVMHIVVALYYTIRNISAEEQARLLMKFPNK